MRKKLLHRPYVTQFCSTKRIRKSIRKSQVTFAIILGVLLVILSALAFYAVSKIGKEKPTITVTEGAVQEKIQDYVESCLKDTLETGILTLGHSGGVYHTSGFPHYTMEQYVFPYFYEQGLAKMPGLDFFEAELAAYIDDNIDACINDFEQFREQGVEFELGKKFTNTMIAPGIVSTKLSYDITAVMQGREYRLQSFKAEAESRLLDVLRSATIFVKEIEENPYFVPVQKMLDESEAKDFKIDAVVYEPDEFFVITIRDDKTVIKGRPYVFVFGVIFNMSNVPPVVDDLSPIIVMPGKGFSVIVPAKDLENTVMMFFTNDTRFPINPYTGVIEGTAPSDLRKDTEVLVLVTDGEDTTTKKIVFRAALK